MVGEHVEKYLTVEPMIEYSKITAMPSQHAIWMQAKSLTALPSIVARIFRFSPSRLYHHLFFRSERTGESAGVVKLANSCGWIRQLSLDLMKHHQLMVPGTQ